MGRKSLGKEGLAVEALGAIAAVGNNVRTARKRRGWGLEEMAGSMLVARKTLSRLEAGDPSVGLSVLAAALHVLGMAGELSRVAAPESDEIGKFFEKRRLPERVRKKQAPAQNLDF
ncbi:MAG: helix-turn-helix transcriptional regulator [Deltaproteobacteria bacterium]|nr:helix-turn-helix transcriptional regulator [Deltaproteobacteria bacterium]